VKVGDRVAGTFFKMGEWSYHCESEISNGGEIDGMLASMSPRSKWVIILPESLMHKVQRSLCSRHRMACTRDEI